MHQLSRHLALTPKAGKVTAKNLYLGTEITADEALWEVFRTFQEPAVLQSELAAQCAEAKVLVPLKEKPALSSVAQNIVDGLGAHGGDLEEFRRNTNRELLRANSELENWTINSWNNPLRVFGNFCSQVDYFLSAETRESSAFRIQDELLKMSLHRPSDRLSFEQQSCTLATTQMRRDLIASAHPQGGRVLLLGDDDLMSLALGLCDDFFIDLFEVDPRLVRFLGGFELPRLTIWRQDLRKGLPDELHGAFDIVVADPTYVAAGMEVFLTTAALGLAPAGRLYLSTCPRMLEDPESFFIGLMGRGLRILENHKNFNRYPMTWSAQFGVAKAFELVDLPAEMAQTMTSIPYLYADLFVCQKVKR